MDGWKQNEKGSLGSNSIGRFSELSDHLKSEIKLLVSSIHLTTKDWPFTSVRHRDISDICQLFDYDYLESNENVSLSKLSLWKEELESTIKMYPTNIFNYPISFK